MRNILLLLLCLFTYTGLMAQPAEKAVRVLVASNHDDLLYKEGETVKFTVTVIRNDIPLKDVEIRYDVSEDMMPAHKSDKLVLKNGTTVINAGTMKKAGFLRCQVYAKYKEREYQGLATVGFSPEKIEPTIPVPDDFIQFWDKAKAEAAKIPMDSKVTLVPEKCTEKVNVYHVSIQNYQYGSRLYGVLCVPKGEGKFPAVLEVPGAGIRPYHGDISNAEQGYITFQIGIHGLPIDLPQSVYNDLGSGALRGYQTFNMDDKDAYYYKRVYLGCVRSIDFIFTLPQFDGTNLLTYGGSQGGALSIVTAGLDSRVKGLVAYYPALCDLTGYLHGRAGGWPHMFRNKAFDVPEKKLTAQYYDVVNFARLINVPGYYSFGYNDMVCPPTSMFSAMNVIKAPKELLIMEDTGHYTYPEQWTGAWKWMSDFLKK